VNPRITLYGAYFLLASTLCCAQKKSADMPDSLIIARDTFWDIGPPFDYYDLIQITQTKDGLSLDQVLVTPQGQACLQPAAGEERIAILPKTMAALLEDRNPCAIPERDLHREINRCKKCSVFSGVHVMMQASCSGTLRQLNINIMDQDIYGSRTPTPQNTSWSMRVLSTINQALGPASESKPIFQVAVAQHREVPQTPLVEAIREGKYDGLFGENSGVSKIIVEAEQPPPPKPSVQVLSVTPFFPVTPEAPNYPPIAIAARVEGIVHASFNVTSDGRAENITFDEPRLPMLQGAAREAMSQWTFPQLAWGQSGRVAIQFALNCH